MLLFVNKIFAFNLIGVLLNQIYNGSLNVIKNRLNFYHS